MDGGHVVLFPFMSKGHTIPILHLTRLLLRRQLSVTVITTPANLPFISHSLSDTSAAVIPLPFPDTIADVPDGVESTDPAISLFVAFTNATAAMQPHFELALRSLSAVSFIVADGFLWWTQESADKFGIPRITFYGMSGYSMTVMSSVTVQQSVAEAETEDELVAVPDFPGIKVARSDFHAAFRAREPKGPLVELAMKHFGASRRSYGTIFNSFYELEPVFADLWNRKCEPKGWWVGPLCLAHPPHSKLSVEPDQTPWWIEWLDQKSDQNKPVLYVAFGSQAEISPEQLTAIAVGLERSEVNFMWVIRNKESDLPEGFEERVKDRGVVVEDWVDQREVLAHVSVQGFLTHCGWNSVVESICAAVPMVAWPMMAEQPTNARMVTEEMRVGIRVEGRGAVAVETAVRELMEGEKGKAVRKAVGEYAAEARKAMSEGGSSWRAMSSLIDEIATIKKKEIITSYVKKM